MHWQAHLSLEMEALVITTLSSLEQNTSAKPEHVDGDSICLHNCYMLIRHGHIIKQYELKKILFRNFHTSYIHSLEIQRIISGTKCIVRFFYS